MAIRLLKTWNGLPIGAILNMGDAATEAALVADFTATYNLAGGAPLQPNDPYADSRDLQDVIAGAPLIGSGFSGVAYDTSGRMSQWTINGQQFTAAYGPDGKIATLTAVGKSVQRFTWLGDQLVSNPVTTI